MENLSTLDEQAPDAGRVPRTMESLALVIAWCADPTCHAGAMAWIPPGESWGTRVFGRGAPTADDPHPRLTFVRQRPGELEAVPALSLPALSRIQLLVSSSGPDGVLLRNVGRCPLLVEGKAVDEVRLTPGTVAQLGQQLLLLCARRSSPLPAPDNYPVGPYGMADTLGLVGESAAIWGLRRQLSLVGPRSGHVLLLGPTGSGKELSARAIHALSNRRNRAMVARNAATIPESLLDAELFGNAKNYPNPGMSERPGLIGEADGSTLFLDEVAELAPAMQAHLLRVLDGGEYHRLGESVARRSDLRMIAATNRQASELKEDLLARFKYLIQVPDLNARREDIPLLTAHLLRRASEADTSLAPCVGRADSRSGSQVSIGICRELLEHTYTFHLRELERILLRTFIDGEGAGFERVDGSEQFAPAGHERSAVAARASAAPNALTPDRIQAVLDEHNGRLETAYRVLGLKNRFALSRLIAKHGLEVRRRPSRRAERRQA